MAPEVKVNPPRLDKYATQLKDEIAPVLEKARTDLNGAVMEGGDFSITGTFCAVAYPGALQFGFEILESHKKDVEDFADKVTKTAKSWRAAEDASTVKTV